MRCRKKGVSTKKQPIEFIESPPLHVPLLPATPVHSCLCPRTADVIPISVADNTWISPQFHNNMARTTRRKQTQRSLHLPDESPADQSFNSTLPRTSRTLLPEKRSVFQPLQFIGIDNSVEKRRRSSVRIKTLTGSLRSLGRDVKCPQIKTPEQVSTTGGTSLCAKVVEPDVMDSQTVCHVHFDVDTPDMSWNELNQRGTCDVATLQLATKVVKNCDVARPCEGVVQQSVAQSMSDCDKLQNSATGRDLLSSILEMTPPSSANKVGTTVLAYDTPACEYELSYRQRVLRSTQIRVLSRSTSTVT